MRIYWGIVFLCFGVSAFGQIAVDTDTYSVEQLVRDILVNNNCAETSNYSSYTGLSEGVNGIGYFNANGSSFQYQEGIVLSTGRAVDSEGPNNNIYNTKPTAWTGDVDLSGITLIPILFNASFIEFDFVPRTNSFSFNFLFASEEYDDNYQCIFSDVFAFILTGPDGVSTNLALVPDTEEPVSATTIRPGIPGSCDPANEAYFFGINGADSPISQFGQTTSLKASSAVVPGATYTIKLVIADNSDPELDSAVYLEAGSFSIDVFLGEDRTIAGGNPLCDAEIITLDATADSAQDYIWYRDGIEISSANGQPSIDVSESGVYAVEVVFSANCSATGEIVLQYVVSPEIVEEPLDLSACDVDGDGAELFDFSQNIQRILGNQDPNLYQVRFYQSQSDAQNFENELTSTTNYSGQQETETIYARISSGESCFAIAQFDLRIQAVDFSSDLATSFAICLDESGNAMAPFPILDTGLPASDFTFQWYADSVSDANLIANATASSYTATMAGEYLVRIGLPSFDCELTISTSVEVLSPPESVTVIQSSALFEENTVIEIQVDGGGEYLFSIDDGPPQESNIFSNVGPGEHTAFVSDIFGCATATEEFFIIDYPKFFTPNTDGKNDTWSIVGLDQIESPELTIYDRHGKLLFQFFDTAWDGTLEGRPLPSSDYWFKISYALNGAQKEFKGHFSLKR